MRQGSLLLEVLAVASWSQLTPAIQLSSRQLLLLKQEKREEQELQNPRPLHDTEAGWTNAIETDLAANEELQKPQQLSSCGNCGTEVAKAPSIAIGCVSDISIPNPFDSEMLAGLYDRVGLLSLHIIYNHALLENAWYPMALSVAEFTQNCEDRMAFKKLLDDGLILTPFGMDFTKVQWNRYGGFTEHGDELNKDEHVQRLKRAFFATRVNRFFFDVDMPVWYRTPVSTGRLSVVEEMQLQQFRSAGYLKIDHWPGLDNVAIQALNHKVFKYADNLVKPGSFLLNMVLGYLGAEAEYHGAKQLHVGKRASRRSYSNAPWHHDGCGQRLKAFIYLHDVTPRHVPTLIAAGTNHLHHFPTTEYFAGPEVGHNKLNRTLVEEVYGDRIHSMIGKVGGGFIFDTNNLHAASVEGKHEARHVVILEFSTQAHMNHIPRGPRGDDDDFMSGFKRNLCPGRHRRVPLPVTELQSNDFLHD